MSRLKRKYQTMRLWWSPWKTSFIIPSILTMYALQVKQRKPQAWEKHCQKGISRIHIVRTSVIFVETGDSSFTIYCPKSESRWAVDGTNTEIGYGSTLSPMFFWRILYPIFLNAFVAVHGFRVQRFRVDVSTVEICIKPWTPRMWLRKASVTFLTKLAPSVARGGAERWTLNLWTVTNLFMLRQLQKDVTSHELRK